MGDWGPGHVPRASASASAAMSRCAECGFTQVSLGAGAACSMCGGTVFRAAAGAGPQDVSRQQLPSEDIQRQAEAILSSILPTDLLNEYSSAPSKPASDEVVADLPLVKVEPHVALRIMRKPPVAAASVSPSRQVLAEAAEQRRAAAAAAAGSTASASGDSLPAVPAPAPAPERAVADRPLELKGTGSAFGTSLAEIGEEGVSGALVVAEPRDGSRELANAAVCRGKVVLMWRGGCSFVEKVRRAQAAGAVAAVVVQTDLKKWPFTMSDTTGAGADVLLPSIMISPKDGDTLLQAVQLVAAAVGASAGMPAAASVDGALPPPPMAPLPALPSAAVVSSSEGGDEREQGASGGGPPIPIPMPIEEAGGGGELWVQAVAVDHQTSCAVCLQELIAEEMAVKLPCNHLFHQDCVRTWCVCPHAYNGDLLRPQPRPRTRPSPSPSPSPF